MFFFLLGGMLVKNTCLEGEVKCKVSRAGVPASCATETLLVTAVVVMRSARLLTAPQLRAAQSCREEAYNESLIRVLSAHIYTFYSGHLNAFAVVLINL